MAVAATAAVLSLAACGSGPSSQDTAYLAALHLPANVPAADVQNLVAAAQSTCDRLKTVPIPAARFASQPGVIDPAAILTLRQSLQTDYLNAYTGEAAIADAAGPVYCPDVYAAVGATYRQPHPGSPASGPIPNGYAPGSPESATCAANPRASICGG